MELSLASSFGAIAGAGITGLLAGQQEEPRQTPIVERREENYTRERFEVGESTEVNIPSDKNNEVPPPGEYKILDIQRDFGVEGSGEEDVTEAFQEAMKEAEAEGGGGGGAVYIPPGEYLIKKVEVFDNTTIYGEGKQSRLLHAPENLEENPATSIFLSDNSNNIEFRNLLFSGNLSAHQYEGPLEMQIQSYLIRSEENICVSRTVISKRCWVVKQ